MIYVSGKSRNIGIAIILALAIACASIPATVTTPAGQYAFKADQVVSALGVFQDAAIAANTNKLLSDNDTGIIVRFVKAEALVLQQGNSGYKVQVSTALTQLNTDLSAAAKTKYGTYISLIQAVVGGL